VQALTLLLTLQGSPFPLEPGTWWEYRESYTEHLPGLDSTTDETTRFEIRGTPEHLFVAQTGGVDPTSGPVEQAPGWIRLTPWTGEDPLPLPLLAGAEGPLEEGVGWRVEAEEEIQVPAGTFRALRCALRAQRAVSLLWIAAGVGVVREIRGAPGAHPDLERVLLRFHARSPGRRQ